MVFCTLFCLMSFFIVITKRKKIYITIIIKRRVGGEKTQEYYDWQTNNHNTAQVPTDGEK